MSFFSLLTIYVAATLMIFNGPILNIRADKVQKDIIEKDHWATRWRAFFKRMDVDGDGKMSEYEFVNMTSARLGAITKSAEKQNKANVLLQENWDKWFKTFMNDANLIEISPDDFISTEAKTREKMVDIQHLVMEVNWPLTLFELVDGDGNDYLNKTEYSNFLKIFRAPFSSALFSEVDSNSDGAIDKSEMIIKEMTWTIGNSIEGDDIYGKIL